MRLLLAIITSFLIASSSLISQSLSVFDIDTTNFPTIKAKFCAFDETGNQIKNLSPSDFEVIENSTMTRPVTNVTCPNSIPVAVSSVLVFDMSGSMVGEAIESAKKAANAWIDGLPAGKSECALVSFDDRSMILHDFTKDRTILKNSIAQLQPDGGTDYNQALIDLPCGGLNIAKTGKFSRVIIFLTDGLPNFEPNTQDIINFANQNQITIYAVTLYMPAPQCIKDITKQTGGEYFENITTQQEAEETYQTLLQLATSVEPCEITWQSGVTCDLTKTNVELMINQLKLTANGSYVLPTSLIASLQFSPRVVEFHNPTIGTPTNKEITITAKNSPYIITNISSSNPSFTITPTNFTLNPNETKTLTISYTPLDSEYAYTQFVLETNTCNHNYWASSVRNDKKSAITTLTIISPNGEEKFVVGSDTLITWAGIPSTDTVTIDYSIDAGINWGNITKTATNFQFNWTNIPLPISSQCLVRIKQNWDANDTNRLIWSSLSSENIVLSLSLSPNGKLIATGNSDSTVKLWNAETGKLIWSTVGTYLDKVLSVDISPDGTKIATGSGDHSLKILDINTGQVLANYITNEAEVTNVRWNYNGTRLASSQVGNIIIWDTRNGDRLRIMGAYSTITCIEWSKDGKNILVGDVDNKIHILDSETSYEKFWRMMHNYDVKALSWNPTNDRFASADIGGAILIWDAKTCNVICSINDSSNGVNGIYWSPDGNRLASGNNQGRLKVWDINTQTKLWEFNCSDEINAVEWSKDGNIIVIGTKSNRLHVLNATNGQENVLFPGHSAPVIFVSWSPNKNLIASVSRDNTIKIWDARNGAEMITFPGRTESIFKLCWNPAGTALATVTKQGEITILDINSGIILKQNKSNSSIFDISWSPDSKYIALADENQNLSIWDLESDNISKTIKISSPIKSIVWGHIPMQIAVLTNENIAILDLESETTIQTLKDSLYHPVCMTWDKKRQKIAVGYSYPYYIKIWDIESGKVEKVLKGCNGNIISLDWSSDENRILSISDDWYIRIWDVISNRVINYLRKGPSFNESNVCWNPEGNKIVFSGVNNTVKVYYIGAPFIQQDISDSLFSIVAPEIHATAIDMKECLVNSIKDSLVTNFIQNTGTYKCRVDSIYFTGADKDVFSLVSGLPKYEVAAGANKATEFRFKPTEERVYNAEIVILTQADTLKVAITGVGVAQNIEVLNNLIDFGIIKCGESKQCTDTATIRNVGKTAITITKITNAGPNNTDFAIVNYAPPYTLPIGRELKLSLKFTATSIGRTSGRLQFDYEGQLYPAEVLLYAQAVGGLVRIDDDSAFAGEKKKIRLRLMNNLAPIQSATALPFRAKIKYNPTLLTITDSRGSKSVDKEYEICDIKGTWDMANGNLLGEFDYVAGLGNSTYSYFLLDEFQWLDNSGQEIKAEVERIDGLFTSLGICKEGGTRLVNPNANIGIQGITPNPAKDKITITAKITEIDTKIKLIDIAGKVILEINCLVDKSKAQEFTIDLTNISAGMYFIEFKSLNFSQVEKVVVEK